MARRIEIGKSDIEKIIGVLKLGKEMKKLREKMEKIEERRIREEEKRKEREKWKKEKETLERRIEELEWINEKAERKIRKKNIVIRSVNWGRASLFPNLQKRAGFHKRQPESESISKKGKHDKFKRKQKFGDNRNRYLEQKREVIIRKRELKKGVIIENDLTRKERNSNDVKRNGKRGERKGIEM